MAQRFDEKQLTLVGDPILLAEAVGRFSVSPQMLAYRPITKLGTQQVLWMNRSGTPGRSVWMPGTFASLRLSPDGNRLALDRDDGIWVIDLGRETPQKLTVNSAVAGNPQMSPDGKRIVFSSTRSGGPQRMFIQSSLSIDTDPPQPLPSETPSDMREVPSDWWGNGNKEYIVFLRAQIGSPNTADIWVKPMFGDGKPFAFVQLKRGVFYGEARLSPNGRWLAYVTNQSGSNQIVLQTFPQPSEKGQPVTVHSGLFPTWRRDGRELYYLALDGKIMAVSVKKVGAQLELGAPTPLFPSPLATPTGPAAYQYDVSPNGERFVFIGNNSTNPTSDASAKLTAVVNWSAALTRSDSKSK